MPHQVPLQFPNSKLILLLRYQRLKSRHLSFDKYIVCRHQPSVCDLFVKKEQSQVVSESFLEHSLHPSGNWYHFEIFHLNKLINSTGRSLYSLQRCITVKVVNSGYLKIKEPWALVCLPPAPLLWLSSSRLSCRGLPPAPFDGEMTTELPPLPDPDNIWPLVTGGMAEAWFEVAAAAVVAPTLDIERPATCG